MNTTVGIFQRRDDAERARERLITLGFRREHVSLLTPHSSDAEIAAVRTSDTEEPGTGAAMGTVIGGAAGASAGIALVGMVPGIGPVFAAGWAAVALMGLFGAVGGGIAGHEVESALSDGLPKDDLFLYEDALRKGHSVLIASAETDGEITEARRVLRDAGAEDVDTARERWWIGLRGEDQEYREPSYRHGVESALHPDVRGKSFDDAAAYLARRHGDEARSDAFRRGYERGRTHCAGLGTRHD